jgi:hypothetical protein
VFCVFFTAMSRVIMTSLVAVLFLTACATPEVLVRRDSAVPAGIDLSGNWRIRPDMENDQRRLQEAIRKTSGANLGSGSRNSKPRKVGGGVVHVFLETGEQLKVTQTASALFISFDRSIVEEFRFGEARIISVGEVQAQRVTGWEEQQLIVETLDKHGVKLTDRFQLVDGGQTLRREITLRSKKHEEQKVLQEFDRVE